MTPDKARSDSRQGKKGGFWRMTARVGLPMVVLVFGAAAAVLIVQTAPQARRRSPMKLAPLVETAEVRSGRQVVVVTALGLVEAARKIDLRARVTGRITSVHNEFVDGGLVKKGDRLIQIDQSDYSLAVTRKKGQVVQAEYALQVEMGYQDVAAREWQLLKRNKPAEPGEADLALRKPHLAKARADLASAKADLEQARLDLARTNIRAPFNALIRSKAVDTGSQVATQDRLSELIDTDEFWITASVPVDRLKWIAIPGRGTGQGSRVRVYIVDDSDPASETWWREGRVIKLLGELETTGRMARVVVAVTDPLDLKPDSRAATGELVRPPLLIGQYVRLEIEGGGLDDVIRIPRSALKSDSSVWLAGEDDRLVRRTVDVAWRDRSHVLIQSGLRDGERLIVSDISAPVEGMKITVLDDSGRDAARSMVLQTTGREPRS